MPRHIGLDMSKCELIFGPMLADEHWYCLVLEPKTMNVHILDSINRTPSKNQRQKNVSADRQMDVAHRCVRFPKLFYAGFMVLVSYLTMSLGVFQLTRFAAMLEAINPAEFCEKPLGRIIRDSVPVQGNLYDCGVHVLIWLLQWSPRARLTYTDADVAIFRSNLMWWLFSHPQNIVKDKALALLDDHVQPKRARIV